MGDTTYITVSGVLRHYKKKKKKKAPLQATYSGKTFTTDQHTVVQLLDTFQSQSIPAMNKLIPKQSLSSDEEQAIYSYSGAAYSEINRGLAYIDSQGATAWEKGLVSTGTAEKIINIHHALDKKISAPLVLWRGESKSAIVNALGISRFEFDNVTNEQLQTLVGKVLPFKSYPSFAYEPDSSFHSKPAFIQMEAPSGVQGRVITDISRYGTGEAEVLLHNSGGHMIDSIYKDKKTGQIIIKSHYVYGKGKG